MRFLKSFIALSVFKTLFPMLFHLSFSKTLLGIYNDVPFIGVYREDKRSLQGHTSQEGLCKVTL